MWYEWQGRHLRIFVNDQRVTEDYACLTGFVRRTGIRSNSANLGWEFQPTASTWWVKVRPFVVIRRQVTTSALLDESYVDPGFDLTLARNLTFYVYHSFHTDSFGGREYGYDFNVIDSELKPFKRVGLEARVQWGEGVNFDPARTEVGDALDWRLALTFKPDDRLNAEALWLKSRLLAKETGERLFGQDIARLRATFQFTREHGTRFIGEYDTRSRRLSLSLLSRLHAAAEHCGVSRLRRSPLPRPGSGRADPPAGMEPAPPDAVPEGLVRLQAVNNKQRVVLSSAEEEPPS